jgi:Tol biopolymer transport system component
MSRLASVALVAGSAAILASGCSLGAPRAPSEVTASSATLNGYVFSTEKDADIQYWFRYGPTTAYSSQTPERTLHIPAEPNYYEPHPISEPIDGLTPWTDYHYQVCTTPPRTGCFSGDEVFTAGPGIAYASEQPTADIWAMDAGGHHQRRVTNGRLALAPAVSPDGTKIAFQAYTGQGNLSVWVMDSDGGNQHAITDPATFSYNPAWSPNGTKIAFSLGAARPEIALMDADGGNVTALTSDGGVAQQAAWSPDGSKIAFTFTGGNDQYEIRTVPAAGGTEVTLGEGGTPDWSPDGTKIAFTRQADIWVMDADGQHATDLTEDELQDAEPAWSPDGSRIAFDRISGGVHRVFLMRSDGSNPTSLTGPGRNAESPSWFPFR